MFQTEVVRVYESQLAGNRTALKPEYASTATPFSYNQFTDVAIRNAVDTVYRNASPRSLPLYNRGRPGSDNWVIRWVLYHVCRYRDSRNKKARSTNFKDDDDLDGSQRMSPFEISLTSAPS